MAARLRESPSRKLKSVVSSEVQLYVNGVPFNFDRELLAAKSSVLDELLRENRRVDLSHVLRDDVLADPEMFELVARFCHGYEIHLSPENAIHVACLAHHLGMTEAHCTNNLLGKAIDFIEHHIISSWIKSIRALHATENILVQAVDLGFVEACVDSIISKALHHPNLLGEPVKMLPSNVVDNEEEDRDVIRTNVRRKLFSHDWKTEDLSMLSVRLFEYIMSSMIQHKVPVEYISAAVCQYAKRWVLSSVNEGDEEGSIHRMNSQREIIEAVERMLPNEAGLLPCASLFEMLKSAIVFEASEECRNGFEMRIGKQLNEATVEDLLIPCQGYAKEQKYDTECVKRILKSFYRNYAGENGQDLVRVAELLENFLIEVASDIDLKMTTFMSLAELSSATSEGVQNCSDGIYRAINLYFEKHSYLTESEREEICQVLECSKMSAEACFHAAQNEKFPVRTVVQVLFMRQLQLRDTIPKEDKGLKLNETRLLLKYEEEEEETGIMQVSNNGEEEEEEVAMRAEMEKMGKKVLELERECHLMRREIERSRSIIKKEEKRMSMWKEMKRKFGCMTSIHDCNSHVKKKKVHPR